MKSKVQENESLKINVSDWESKFNDLDYKFLKNSKELDDLKYKIAQ